MKKRRGLKRYYNKLNQRNEWISWCEYLSDPMAWCNFSHQHFDWKGYGNIRWKEREAHLTVLFKHFSIIAEHLKNYERPYQMYAILHLRDSGQDALFFHTPNPYSDFPYKAIRHTLGIICSRKNPLIGYLRELEHQGFTVLTSTKESDNKERFIVFKERVGEPLIAENYNRQQTD